MKKLLFLLILLSTPLLAGNQYIQYSTANSGTITIADTGTNVLLIQEATIATTLTIALPATPFDGQEVRISSIGGVTTLTLTTSVGSIIGGLATIGAGGIFGYTYRGSTTKWYRTL